MYVGKRVKLNKKEKLLINMYINNYLNINIIVSMVNVYLNGNNALSVLTAGWYLYDFLYEHDYKLLIFIVLKQFSLQNFLYLCSIFQMDLHLRLSLLRLRT